MFFSRSKKSAPVYAFCEARTATEMSAQHIRLLETGEQLIGGGYEGKTALCGTTVHWDVSVVTEPVIEWSKRMREEGRAVPGRTCVGCSHLWEERDL